MESVDVRIPGDYSEILQKRVNFWSDFLKVVFECLEISDVKSMERFVLPTFSLSDVATILNLLQSSTFSVKNIFISLSLESDNTTQLSVDISRISKVVSAARVMPSELTFVSNSPVLPELVRTITTACRRRKRVKITSLRSEEETAGPEYLRELGKVDSEGEMVGPHSLVSSINTATTISACGGMESGSSGSGERDSVAARTKAVGDVLCYSNPTDYGWFWGLDLTQCTSHCNCT